MYILLLSCFNSEIYTVSRLPQWLLKLPTEQHIDKFDRMTTFLFFPVIVI